MSHGCFALLIDTNIGENTGTFHKILRRRAQLQHPPPASPIWLGLTACRWFLSKARARMNIIVPPSLITIIYFNYWGSRLGNQKSKADQDCHQHFKNTCFRYRIILFTFFLNTFFALGEMILSTPLLCRRVSWFSSISPFLLNPSGNLYRNFKDPED